MADIVRVVIKVVVYMAVEGVVLVRLNIIVERYSVHYELDNAIELTKITKPLMCFTAPTTLTS